jgi:AraC family transcriptional regulator
MLMNAGQDSVWHCAEPIDELHIFLDPRIVAEVAEEAGAPGLHLIDGVGLIDPGLREISSQLLAELESPGIATRLFADTMARALALQLIRQHSTVRVRDTDRIEMTSRQLRAATDYIDSHIDEELTLESISSAIAMSPFRFARGFRKAAGHSPRQYIIQRRIERAKDLLRASRRGLAEIASLVGFSTQSHFTAMFRRHCGMTPKRYRDAIKAC